MPRILIPSIGERLTLTADWTFTLHQEHRNVKFAAQFGLVWSSWPARGATAEKAEIKLPAGTILTVARIYVRSGRDRFDSVTFSIARPKGKAGKGAVAGRFWCRLADANRIEYASAAEVLAPSLDAAAAKARALADALG